MPPARPRARRGVDLAGVDAEHADLPPVGELERVAVDHVGDRHPFARADTGAVMAAAVAAVVGAAEVVRGVVTLDEPATLLVVAGSSSPLSASTHAPTSRTSARAPTIFLATRKISIRRSVRYGSLGAYSAARGARPLEDPDRRPGRQRRVGHPRRLVLQGGAPLLAPPGELGLIARGEQPGGLARVPAAADICPVTGRGRLSYPCAEYLFKTATAKLDPHRQG